MKSRITIEVDFDNANNPILQILRSDSDDVRDKLLKAFTEKLGYTSSWCQIKFIGGMLGIEKDATPITKIHIRPIEPKELEEQASIMLEQSKINGQNLARTL